MEKKKDDFLVTDLEADDIEDFLTELEFGKKK